jgi:hypothetical protein
VIEEMQMVSAIGRGTAAQREAELANMLGNDFFVAGRLRVTAQSVGAQGLSARLILMGEAMIAAHVKGRAGGSPYARRR